MDRIGNWLGMIRFFFPSDTPLDLQNAVESAYRRGKEVELTMKGYDGPAYIDRGFIDREEGLASGTSTVMFYMPEHDETAAEGYVESPEEDFESEDFEEADNGLYVLDLNRVLKIVCEGEVLYERPPSV